MSTEYKIREAFKLNQKFIPPDKRTKKKKKEYYAARRADWNGINPVTKKTADIKIYDRKKIGKRYEYESPPDFILPRFL